MLSLYRNLDQDDRIYECLLKSMQHKGNSKKTHSNSCRTAWLKMIKRSVLQQLRFKQKEVELLLLLLFIV